MFKKTLIFMTTFASLLTILGCGSVTQSDNRLQYVTAKDVGNQSHPKACRTIKCHVLDAMPFFKDYDRGLVQAIAAEDLPKPARDRATKLEKVIRHKNAQGTNYRATIDGYYTVHKTRHTDQVLAYVIRTSGSAEPDYQDMVIFVFNKDGQVLFTESDNR